MAVRSRGSDSFAFGGPAPFAGRGDRAVVRGEADQHGLVAVALTGELPDVELTS